jgi:hypothetical protein
VRVETYPLEDTLQNTKNNREERILCRHCCCPKEEKQRKKRGKRREFLLPREGESLREFTFSSFELAETERKEVKRRNSSLLEFREETEKTEERRRRVRRED